MEIQKIKVKELNNLHKGDHIIVEFDVQGAVYGGEAHGLLVGYWQLSANCFQSTLKDGMVNGYS
jgi:hypothetical protein